MQSFRQRIYPNTAQVSHLRQEFGACRFVYNWALALRSASWVESKTRLTSGVIGKKLTALKKEEGKEWLKERTARSISYALMNLDAAFSNFFSKKAKYPTFKRKSSYGGSTKYDSSQFKLIGGGLYLPKLVGEIKVRWTRKLPCSPKFVTVSQDACGDFWAAFTCDTDPAPRERAAGEIGIDLGITAFATLSTGDKVKAPDLKRKIEHVKILQRRASRKVKASNNRRKALRKVARGHRKVTDSRKDFHHKLSSRLIDENQVIAIEDLAVKNMVKNRKLARAISEQGWSSFTTMLGYKAKWHGRTVVRVDRFFPSSKTCSCCAFVVEKLPLNIREWECPRCSATHDRDVNAARNILAASKVVLACGVDGRPVSGSRKKAVGSEAGRKK